MAKFDHLDERALWAAIIESEASYYCAVIALDEACNYPLPPEEIKELREQFKNADRKHQELINERERRNAARYED